MALMLRRLISVLVVLVSMGLWAGAPAALAAGDANQATCPNEALTGFHLYLADCRAYEMVSPPYKAGQSVIGERKYTVAADGEAVAFPSAGVFAEAPVSIEGYNGYLATRGNGGWSTVSINPNPAISPGFGSLEQPSDVSSDLAKSVVLYVFTANRGQRENASSGAFYLRERDGTQVKASPTFTTVSGEPLFPRGLAYEGASADLSTILFHLNLSLLPSDTIPASEPRLYEVSGAGGPSTTLSLLGGGGCPWLGSGAFGSAYHAISRDGKRIFRSCGELFVHIDGSGDY